MCCDESVVYLCETDTFVLMNQLSSLLFAFVKCDSEFS